jgi:putative DNA primase/helicase
MPYGPTFGGKIREQVGLKRTGSEMDPPEFIRMAEGKRLTADQFKELDRLEKETRKKQEKKWGPTDPERIKSALKAIDPDITRPDWFAIGCALCSEMGEEGLKLWDEWSKSGSKYDPKSMSRGRADIAEAEGFAYTIRTVFHFAKLAGWKDNKKRAKKIAEAENWEPPPRDDGRPTIKVYGGGLVAIADEGMKALLASGLPIFQRSDHLVRPIIAEVDAADGRKTHTAHLAELDQTYTRDILGRAAVWIKFNKTERVWVPTDPPHETAATIRARKGEWEFPRITGIISTPTMRPDGTLLTEPGYDASTGLLLHHPPEMPPIPEQPTREDALKALELLEGLLGEFPFIEDEQGSDAVARSVAVD